jgi:hypothetical protein
MHVDSDTTLCESCSYGKIRDTGDANASKTNHLQRDFTTGDLARGQPTRRYRTGYARAKGPQCRSRKEVRWPNDHQGWCNRRERDPTKVFVGAGTIVPASDVPAEGLFTRRVISTVNINLSAADALGLVVFEKWEPGALDSIARFSLLIPYSGESETRTLRLTPIAAPASFTALILVDDRLYRELKVELQLDGMTEYLDIRPIDSGADAAETAPEPTSVPARDFEQPAVSLPCAEIKEDLTHTQAQRLVNPDDLQGIWRERCEQEYTP